MKKLVGATWRSFQQMTPRGSGTMRTRQVAPVDSCMHASLCSAKEAQGPSSGACFIADCLLVTAD